MKDSILKIECNQKIAPDVYKMVLVGDVSAVDNPGQFIDIKLDGFYLRRPISVCDREDGKLTVIYKTVGEGTEKMSTLSQGETLDVLVGLGNGYDTSKSGESPLLIGGGVGIPPLYFLCKRLISECKKVSVILGFNKKEEIFLEDEFRKLTPRVYVTTADGSEGIRGFVTDAMKGLEYTYFYTCGPMPMFRAINRTATGSGQFSFEERMGCGFGACMGCSCKTVGGYKRICKDGPVLQREEILWEEI